MRCAPRHLPGRAARGYQRPGSRFAAPSTAVLDATAAAASTGAGSLILRALVSAGACDACTTLLSQTDCGRPDQRRWGSPCVITN